MFLNLRRADLPRLPPVLDRFGIRSFSQVTRDLTEVVRGSLDRSRFQFDLSSTGLLRPDLALPAYAGFIPEDGMAPIFNLFDRTGGGRNYTQRVTRRTVLDFRKRRLSYDEHDGTDLVCPVGTPLTAAAPGTVVLIRDRWLRGGLTVAVDHGFGVVTQYTHCSSALLPLGAQVERGQPVALSGAAGFDMVQFFPLVPPHIHFMVWVGGVPVDPFLAKGEAERPGLWWPRNRPRPSGPLDDDPSAPELSKVDETALFEVSAKCTDRRIKEELQAVQDQPAMLAALLEDALHHDAWAWPEANPRRPLRPRQDASAVKITLPLPADDYCGCFFADWAPNT